MVTSMLEKAIEIEGLLRIIRDGNPMPETYILLNTKTGELAKQAHSLEERASSSEAGAASADFQLAVAVEDTAPGAVEVALTPQEKTKTRQKPEDQKDTMAESTEIAKETHTEANTERKDDFGMQDQKEPHAEKFDFTMETAEEIPLTPPVLFTEDVAASMENNSEIDKPSIAQGMETYPDLDDLVLAEEDDIILSFDDTSDFSMSASTETPGIQEATETEADAQSSIPMEQVAKRQVKLKSVFSLNDRFLYSRELFDGNMKMFDSTLEFIEGIEEFSVIEDYFYSELEWDRENQNVASFMEILKPHFRV